MYLIIRKKQGQETKYWNGVKFCQIKDGMAPLLFKEKYPAQVSKFMIDEKEGYQYFCEPASMFRDWLIEPVAKQLKVMERAKPKPKVKHITESFK